MKFAFPMALSLALGAFAAPAYAQTAGGMPSMDMGGAGGGPKITPKIQPPSLAPAGLPGIGAGAPLATGPKLQKAASGDPTQELFDAINGNNYAAAQDAISRGADLRATDQFGETPLDLAIALNRNDITFMLLGTRNELAAQGMGTDMTGAPWTLDNTSGHAKQGAASRAAPLVPVRATQRIPLATGSTGTPDPQAGFLGFGPKS